MSCLLGPGMTVTLHDAIETGGLVTIQSASWDENNATTAINLLNNSGDKLLQMSLRQSTNDIVFNSQPANGQKGEEGREVLKGFFLLPDFSITIFDHGDRYQLLFSHQTVDYFNKRIHGVISSIPYDYPGEDTPFSEALVVSVYDALGILALTSRPICSEIRSNPAMK
ncbi:MAG: hypothetical protein Q9160_008880, partial [Pyrenula sp. 1 TL-2023]